MSLAGCVLWPLRVPRPGTAGPGEGLTQPGPLLVPLRPAAPSAERLEGIHPSEESRGPSWTLRSWPGALLECDISKDGGGGIGRESTGAFGS